MSASPTRVFELMLQFEGDSELEMRRGGVFASESIAEQALAGYSARQHVVRHVIRPVNVHAGVPPMHVWNAAVKLADLSTLSCFEPTYPSFEPQEGCDFRDDLAESLAWKELPNARAWATGATREEAIERVLAIRQEALDRGFMAMCEQGQKITAKAKATVEAELGPEPRYDDCRGPSGKVEDFFELEFAWQQRFKKVRKALVDEAVAAAKG